MIVLVVIALAVVGCGDQGLFDGVGDRTRTFVEGETTTTVAIPTVAAGAAGEAVVDVSDVGWFNDSKEFQATGTPTEVIAEVWRNRPDVNRFVQSSRAEIAAALPGIGFPELVPEDVRWITSQLVYQPTQGTLDPDTSAAFGLWASEPYQSDAGRVGVLRVGRAPIGSPIGRSELSSIVVPDGLSLGWTEGLLRYELFCSAQISSQLCEEVAMSTVALEEIG